LERSVQTYWTVRSKMSSEDRVTGKPQFDEAAVIAAAVQVFWRHGYAAASISDLTEATGLSRSSLYQRFRDKDGLFQEALAAYLDRVLRRMEAAEGETARARLDALLRGFVLRPSADRPAGCLIARSCAELAELSPEGRRAASTAAARQREVLAKLLQEAKVKGELAEDTDVEAMSWHYLGVLQAALNLPQAGADSDAINRMIDVAMSAWPKSFVGPAQ
jgi:TetR/AcrR family transcriptional regulator, copper-responsive repressor